MKRKKKRSKKPVRTRKPREELPFLRRQKLLKAFVHVSEELDYEKWAKEIPFIEWPTAWKVKAVPSCNLALIKYIVRVGLKEYRISLDCHEALGSYIDQCGKSVPYWQVQFSGRYGKCRMENVDTLIEAIRKDAAMPDSEQELRQRIFQKVKLHMQWTDEKTDFWINSPNPLLGGATPGEFISLRPLKSEKWINSMIDGEGP